jgi:hypothetical protein
MLARADLRTKSGACWKGRDMHFIRLPWRH